ncbi:MAG: hypothetical protein PHS92_00720 [Candidatus Gracilibacteria bacterium]|nr:hypothetical protein [Candidatus Gracilibacteria bacterium]
MRKVICLLFLLNITSSAFAEASKIDFKYIKYAGEGSYNFYIENPPANFNEMKSYVNSKIIDASNIKSENGYLKISNINPLNSEFYVEKMAVTYSDLGVAQYTADSTTEKIRVKKLADIYFKGDYMMENKGYTDIYNIRLNKSTNNISSSSFSVEKTYSININGTDFPLEKYTPSMEKDKYYLNNDTVTFLAKNLKEADNRITLKVDGLNSNYISIKKEKYSIQDISKIEVSEDSMDPNVRIYFSKPTNLTNMDNKDIYVNGKILDKNNVTLGGNLLVIKYPLKNLGSNVNNLNIYLKDTLQGDYSNIKTVNVENLIRFNITSVDLGDYKNQNFTFKINGDSAAGYYGELNNIKVNLNGVDYSLYGIQDLVKDDKGQVVKDIDGNDKFNIINKISTRKITKGIEFDFAYKYLKTGENIIYVKNNNFGRETNKVSFIKGSSAKMNFNYMTGSLSAQNKESLSFEQYPTLDNKKIDYLNKSETDFNIGKIKLNNLSDGNTYKFDFKIKTNVKINPFSNLKLNQTSLSASYNSDGTISFSFSKIGTNADLLSENILSLSLNELFNTVGNNIELSIIDLKLQRFNNKNEFENLYSSSSFYKINLAYFYKDTGCFDGIKDYCGTIGVEDPILSLSTSYNGSESKLDTSSTSITASTNTTVTSNNKINVSAILNYTYKKSSNNAAKKKLTDHYNSLKKKKIDSKKLVKVKNSINTILRTLKNVEDNKVRTSTGNKIIKAEIKKINANSK